MYKELILKPATITDGEILFQWCNDPETRKASHDTNEINWTDHLIWLNQTLKNPDRQLFIVWEKTKDPTNSLSYIVSIIRPVGTVRIDHDKLEDTYELSWTVAPEARGRGIGKRIVKIITNQMRDKNIKAEIRPDNKASIKIAEFAGLKLNYALDEISFYFRDGKLND